MECPYCNVVIYFELNQQEFSSNLQGEVATINLEVHGNPPHVLTVYITKNGKIKGAFPFLTKKTAEKKSNLQFNHIVDASSEITIEDGKKLDIEVIPFDIIIDGKIKKKYLEEIDRNEIHKLLQQKHKIETAPIITEKFLEVFNSYDNDKQFIVNTIGSQFNDTYKNALKARKKLEKENITLANQINIFDSFTAGEMLGFIAKNAVSLDLKKSNLNEIISSLQWLRSNHRTYFIINDISFLKGSFLLNRFSKFFGSISGNKPIISCNVDGNGKIEPVKNVQSMKEGLTEISRLINNDFRTKTFRGTISHVCCEQNAIRLLEYLEIMFNINKNDFSIEQCCSSFGVCAGLGALGLTVFPKL